MTEFYIPPVKSPKILSVRMDSTIVRKLEQLAHKYNFGDKSKLVRFIICTVLDELGAFNSPEERGLCFQSELRLHWSFWRNEPDSDLAIAVLDVTLMLKLLEGDDWAPPIEDYARELAYALA